jgi:hypothetical protein
LLKTTDFSIQCLRHCERSEAIHRGGMAGSMDCFVAYAPRNDTP